MAFIADRFKTRRVTATLIVLIPVFGLSSVCALSQGSLSHVTLAGMTIFDFLDEVATNILLPIVAFFTCIYVGWFAPRKLLLDEVTNRGAMRSRAHGTIRFILRYIAPLLTAIILLSRYL